VAVAKTNVTVKTLMTCRASLLSMSDICESGVVEDMICQIKWPSFWS
jgi:hypothetical protein